MGALLPERDSGRLPERDSRHWPGRDPGRWLVDDLRPQDRGAGAVDALLAALQQRCRKRGWSHVRWVTRASNTTAQSTYERLAVHTDLLTYDLEAAP